LRSNDHAFAYKLPTAMLFSGDRHFLFHGQTTTTAMAGVGQDGASNSRFIDSPKFADCEVDRRKDLAPPA
jgi:hypothetical protein